MRPWRACPGTGSGGDPAACRRHDRPAEGPERGIAPPDSDPPHGPRHVNLRHRKGPRPEPGDRPPPREPAPPGEPDRADEERGPREPRREVLSPPRRGDRLEHDLGPAERGGQGG